MRLLLQQFAHITVNEAYACRLPGVSSVFTAQRRALLLAVRYIQTQNRLNMNAFLIWTRTK